MPDTSQIFSKYSYGSYSVLKSIHLILQCKLDVKCHCHSKSETTTEYLDRKLLLTPCIHVPMYHLFGPQGFQTIINWGENRVGICTATESLPNPEDNGNYQ